MLPKSFVSEAQDIPTRSSKPLVMIQRVGTTKERKKELVFLLKKQHLVVQHAVAHKPFFVMHIQKFGHVVVHKPFFVMYIQKFGYTYHVFLNSKQYLFKHRAKNVIPNKHYSTSNR